MSQIKKFVGLTQEKQISDQSDTGAGEGSIFLFYFLPGVLQGFGIYKFNPYGTYESGAFLWPAIGLFLMIAPAAYYFTTRAGQRLSSAVFGALMGSICAGLLILSINVFGSLNEVETIAPVSGFSSLLITYIAIPFYRTIFERKQDPLNYPSLFEFAWNIPVIAIASLAFVGIVWLVLALWGGLFSLIGIEFFNDIFYEEPFIQIATFGAGALGVGILRTRENIVLALRGVLFALLKVLTPVLAIVTAAFAISAFARGFENLWGEWSATSLMVSAVTAAVILTNAVVADKQQDQHPLLRWSVPLQALVLPVLAGFAVYGLWLRIGEYGLTVARIHAGIVVGVASAYSVVYAISALIPDRYRLWRMGNIFLAGILVALAVLIQTPLLNSYKISADNQVERLISGEDTIDEFDFAYLYFDLGKAGKGALARLQNDESFSDRETVNAKIELMSTADSAWAYRRQQRETMTLGKTEKLLERGDLQLYHLRETEEAIVTAKAIFTALPVHHRDDCGVAGAVCYIFGGHLLEGESEQALYVADHPSANGSMARLEFIFLYSPEGDGTWERVGSVQYFRMESEEEGQRIIDNLIAHPLSATPVSLPSVTVGDEVFIPGYADRSTLRILMVGKNISPETTGEQ